MKLLFVVIAAILTFAMLLAAADPDGYAQYSSADLKTRVDAAKADDHKVRLDRVANWGNHGLLAIRREGDGEAEIHETQVDVIFVKSGEGTLIIGGTMASLAPPRPERFARSRSKEASARRWPPATSSIFLPKFRIRCWCRRPLASKWSRSIASSCHFLARSSIQA